MRVLTYYTIEKKRHLRNTEEEAWEKTKMYITSQNYYLANMWGSWVIQFKPFLRDTVWWLFQGCVKETINVECNISRYHHSCKLLWKFYFPTKFDAKNFYKRDGKVQVTTRKFAGSFLETSSFTSSKKNQKFKV